jgi:ribosomal-protein-alanine N-acetyltransferase
MNYLKKDLLPIVTERLTLRLVEPEEAELMIDYVTENREHLAYWEPIRTDEFYTPEYWKKELIKRQSDFYVGSSMNLAIFFKELPEGPIIGVCNFTNIMRGVFQACFLGYSIHCNYQGRGIMYEALNAAGDFMFDTFKLHRVMANYMPRNERSGKLLKKLGFTIEGYSRDYLKINGKWEDHILTAKIKSDEKEK